MGLCFLFLCGTQLLRIFPSAFPSMTIHPLSQFGSAVMYRKSGSRNRPHILTGSDFCKNQAARLLRAMVCNQHNSREIYPKVGAKSTQKRVQLFRKILLDKNSDVWYNKSANNTIRKTEICKKLLFMCVKFKRRILCGNTLFELLI